MNDLCTYLIELRGQVEAGEVNALSPLSITVVRIGRAVTVVAACSDQAGLIGLLRHLHGLGYILVSLNRLENV